ncbi:hypothetical protein L211DRAFT_875603 [Terfezia boudieri ATCC MYA-4762]|uniref:Uncharacterized protein n=1 Tax=Terfezia boudieri ATCC MYA-4762 TaxID=1051890 RepID=A0A3N4LS28_9PEZI|nr:hypothetical protein L211DRAFT_875603 [Terfezia boudieri ATCC MYA-4762]
MNNISWATCTRCDDLYLLRAGRCAQPCCPGGWCLPCTSEHHTHHRRRDRAEAAIQNGEIPLAMPVWYDRAPRGIIPTPPRILFDNPERESSGSERNSGDSDTERSRGTNSQPEAITITPRDERAAEIVPWVRALSYGDRLRLAGFTSQADRESLVMREPTFQLHLRQTLQMRLTSLTPAHVLYRQREMRLFGAFASGLPVGLAVLSANVMRVAALGRREYMLDIGRGLEVWHQARQETMDFISQHGRDHPFVPELVQWLRTAGRGMFGRAWEMAQLEDHPAPLRTSRHPVLRTEIEMAPVHSLATGPTSPPCPGTMDAHDAMYWARMNQWRGSLQGFSQIDLERDLLRRTIWGRLHRPVNHNGRRNAISGPSGIGLILTGMIPNPRIQEAGVNDSPSWVVGESEEESTDVGTETDEGTGSDRREGEEGYTAGSEGSDGDSAELEVGSSAQQGDQSEGTEENLSPAFTVPRIGSTTVSRNLSSRSSSEPPVRRTPYCYPLRNPVPNPQLGSPRTSSEPHAAGMSNASVPVPLAMAGHPSGLLTGSLVSFETMQTVSGTPQEMDIIHVPDSTAIPRGASESLPETETSIPETRLWRAPSAPRPLIGASRLSGILLPPEISRDTSQQIPDDGFHSTSIPGVTRAESELFGEVHPDRTTASGPGRALQPGFSLAFASCDPELFEETPLKIKDRRSPLNTGQPAPTNVARGRTTTSGDNANAESQSSEPTLDCGDVVMTPLVDSYDAPTTTKQDEEGARWEDEGATESLETMVLAQIIEWEMADMEAAMQNAVVVEDDNGTE